MIHLKTIADGDAQQYAVLLEPNVQGIRNNSDLYQAVRVHGHAEIGIFDGVTYTIKEKQTVWPEDFERKWQGD